MLDHTNKKPNLPIKNSLSGYDLPLFGVKF